MRHEHERRAFLPVEPENQIHHRRRRGTIEIPGRLVTKQNLRPVHKRPRQGDALLLTAGKLHRIVLIALSEPHPPQQLPRLGFARGVTGQLHRHEHIFQGRQRRDQLEILKHKAHVGISHQRPRILAHLANTLARDAHRAAAGSVEPGTQPEERRLAAAARPDDRRARASENVETHLAQHRQFAARSGAIRFGQSLDFQHGLNTFHENRPRKTRTTQKPA